MNNYVNLGFAKRHIWSSSLVPEKADTEILRSFRKTIARNVDVLRVAKQLRLDDTMQEEIFNNITRFCQRTDLKDVTTRVRILGYIENQCSSKAFIQALYKTGYHRLANVIIRAIQESLSASQIPIVGQSKVANRRCLYVFVRNIKMMTDNRIFKDMPKALRSISCRLRVKLDETSGNEQQKMADMYFGSVSMEVDNLGFSPNPYVSLNGLLKELQKTIRFTSNPALSEALYYIRLGIIRSVSGAIEEGKAMMKKAAGICLITEFCPEVTNVYMECVHVTMCEYEQKPSDEVYSRLIQMGNIGLESTESAAEDIREIWVRFFLIKMLYGVLGLGLSTKVVPGVTVTDDRILKANEYIMVLNSLYGTMEARRKMFYLVALARFHELKGELTQACENIQNARLIANDAGYREMINIENYERHLLSASNQTLVKRIG